MTTQSLTPGLNWYRANVPPESWLAHPVSLPPVRVPTMGAALSVTSDLTRAHPQVGAGLEISRTLRLNYRGALNRDAHRGQWKGGRAGHHRSIDDAVLAAVARAVDGTAGHGVDDAALMGADGGERVEGTGLRLRDHDLLVGEDLAAAYRDLSRAGQDVGRATASR